MFTASAPTFTSAAHMLQQQYQPFTYSPMALTKLHQIRSSSLPRHCFLRRLVSCKSSEADDVSSYSSAEEEEEEEEEDEWLKRIPDKKKPLYSHSLPCIEAWLRNLGFDQSTDDRAIWFIQKPDWHAQLSLDVTDLYIRYLKSGPGNLEKDVERRFSYALSREDIENAVVGGP